MIEARRLQRSFGDGLIAEEIEDLQEAWMQHVDMVRRSYQRSTKPWRNAVPTVAGMADLVTQPKSCCDY